MLAESYSYDANDRLLSTTTSTYTYDNNGNTISETTSQGLFTYSYDLDNRVREATTPSVAVAYSYDSSGIRQSKTVAGVETLYTVDKNRDYAQVLEERDGATGNLLVEYIHGIDLLSQQVSGQGSYYYHVDGLGSARALTDNSQLLTDSYDYEAFGEEIAGFGATPNNYKFVGEQLDSEVGKYYLRDRYYAPQNGRFGQMDRFAGFDGKPKSLNKFAYADGNPVMAVDPSGRFTIVGALGGVAAIGVAGSGVIGLMTVIGPPQSSMKGWRPDSDGYITFWEAAFWWGNGNGQEQSVPLSSLDLSAISVSEFTNIGSRLNANFDLPWHFSSFNDAVVYGGLSLEFVGNREVKAVAGYDIFDFEQHPLKGSIAGQFKTSLRNLQTFYGRVSLGRGKPFKIHLTGKASIGE